MPALPATHSLPPAETGESRSALPLRNDTMLGVCQGIGEEFGFHANWLRVPIAALVILNWMAALGTYFALGLALLAARLIYPRRPADSGQPATSPRESLSADNIDEGMSAAA